MSGGRRTDPRELSNRVKLFRERLGLSQQALADSIGVSRQAIIGIERSQQVPSTSLALRLAGTLGCPVEALFSLAASPGVTARVAPFKPIFPESSAAAVRDVRVVLGKVEALWAAHVLGLDSTLAADGVLPGHVGGMDTVGERIVQPLDDPVTLERNALVTGCAPLLGLLAGRTGTRFRDARATWLPGTSRRALDLLAAGLVHVAGVHLPGTGEALEKLVRERFPDRRMLILNLTRWKEGFVVAPGNPLGVRTGEDLLAPGLRFAGREEGAGAHRLVRDLLAGVGANDHQLVGPQAVGHAEVANLVRCGAADVGVAIEGVALAAGMDFVPLMEERFDLVVSASAAESAPVSRLLSVLEHRTFRTDMDLLPGYDSQLSGHVTTIEAA